MESLVGSKIQLRPMLASDAAALVDAAADGELWNSTVSVVPSAATMNAYIGSALQRQAAETVMPFAIEIIERRHVIGSTRFWKIDRQNRKLEIGHTWISASWQRTFVNTEAKFLGCATPFNK